MRILIVIGLILLVAPLLVKGNPRQTDLEHSLEPPSWEHPLGTDLLGRDVFVRLLHGGSRTVNSAAAATLIALVAGLILGIGAAEIHDIIFDGIIDALLAVPGLVVALVIMTILGKGAANIILAVGIAQAAPFARTTRDAITGQRNLPYIESAISIGANRPRIIIHYLLRNAIPELITFTGITFSWALLNGAALAFLGFSGDPSVPDWGVMLAAGRQTFASSPWEALSAGIALTFVVGAVHRVTTTASE